jgi:hypothetical protein
MNFFIGFADELTKLAQKTAPGGGRVGPTGIFHPKSVAPMKAQKKYVTKTPKMKAPWAEARELNLINRMMSKLKAKQ